MSLHNFRIVNIILNRYILFYKYSFVNYIFTIKYATSIIIINYAADNLVAFLA